MLPNTWIPPPQGYLKFNIDGAVKGSYGDAGIGGCLRNDKSQCLISFSKSVGLSDVTTAEIRALVEACKLFKIFGFLMLQLLVGLVASLTSAIGSYSSCLIG
ncbi:hypothetical protein V6N12_005467 [Hibiscus sabdariffa]|uniref:RNase H type-1 domain-containing protein n=1 Tax=Hibiscus sabdariffa TaxID=183260 RepID=A0ABR2B6F6_9ROSI